MVDDGDSTATISTISRIPSIFSKIVACGRCGESVDFGDFSRIFLPKI